jgi:hypothetical protein
MLEMSVIGRVMVSGRRAMLSEAIRRFFKDCHLMMCGLRRLKNHVLPSTAIYEGHFLSESGLGKGAYEQGSCSLGCI